MNIVEIDVGGDRVVIGPPALVPLAGSSRFHPIEAIRRIFERPDSIERLRGAWPQLGLPGNARQMTPAELRRALEEGGAARRVVALYLPTTEAITIDLGWYELDTPKGPAAPEAARDDRPFVAWSEREKIARAFELTWPKLESRGKAELAAALKALLDEKTIAVMIGLMLALMAAHAYGVGEIADIALIAYAYATAGTQGVLAIGRIADATIDAARAKNPADLDRVADRYAEAFVTLGTAFLTGLLTRMMQRAGGKTKAPEAAPKRPPDATTATPEPPAVRPRVPTPTSLLKPLLDAESVIARQKGLALEKLHALAVENQKKLVELGKGIAERTGSSFKDPGVKSLERAAEKLANEGYAEAAGLKDLSRAAFTVRDRAQAEAIVAELRKTYPLYDKGWQRLESGYLDRKLILQSPNGGVTEIQLVPETIWGYKVGAGHELYETVRTTDNVALAKALREESAQRFGELLKGTPFDKGQ